MRKRRRRRPWGDRDSSANRAKRVEEAQRREDRFIGPGVDTFLRALPAQIHVRLTEPVELVFDGDEVFDRLDQEQEFAPLAARLREVDPSFPDLRRARFHAAFRRRTGTGFACDLSGAAAQDRSHRSANGSKREILVVMAIPFCLGAMQTQERFGQLAYSIGRAALSAFARSRTMASSRMDKATKARGAPRPNLSRHRRPLSAEGDAPKRLEHASIVHASPAFPREASKTAHRAVTNGRARRAFVRRRSRLHASKTLKT